MKKVVTVMLSLMLMLPCFLPAAAEAKKISVITTIFPLYDWTREVVGQDSGNVELTMLLGNGVDLHSYQPTVQDIVRISTCDVFIYVGGESDKWVSSALAEAVNKDMKVINLLEAMGEDLKTKEIVEGMEHDHGHEEDHDHEAEANHDHEEDHDHEHEEEADEHVWLSLRNAQKLVQVIAATLSEADPADAEKYQANAAAYREKLAQLDARYAEAVNAAEKKTLLFGDRFPFRYLVDDYGLSYYAAFSGCSAETEASFETIVFLARKVDELGLSTVLTMENAKTRIAETIVESTSAKNQKVLAMDSMQGTTSAGVQSGVTYLSIMENNLKVLEEALR